MAILWGEISYLSYATKCSVSFLGAKQRELCAIFGAKVSIENNLLFGTTFFEKSGSKQIASNLF